MYVVETTAWRRSNNVASACTFAVRGAYSKLVNLALTRAVRRTSAVASARFVVLIACLEQVVVLCRRQACQCHARWMAAGLSTSISIIVLTSPSRPAPARRRPSVAEIIFRNVICGLSAPAAAHREAGNAGAYFPRDALHYPADGQCGRLVCAVCCYHRWR